MYHALDEFSSRKIRQKEQPTVDSSVFLKRSLVASKFRPSTNLMERIFNTCFSAPTAAAEQNQDTDLGIAGAFEQSARMMLGWTSAAEWVNGLPQFGLRASSSWEHVAPVVSRTSVCAWPINPPALARERRPNQFLRRCSLCVVIQ